FLLLILLMFLILFLISLLILLFLFRISAPTNCQSAVAGSKSGTGSIMQILFEDNHCIAVAKPPALLTQGVPPGIPTLEAMVKDYLRERYHKPGNVYLGIPHRLDRPVSGVVWFTRNTKAARRLAEQVSQREVSTLAGALVV